MRSIFDFVGSLGVPDQKFVETTTAAMHQANEHRLTSIEGWLRLNFLAVMFGGILMALQLMGLRDQVIRQNGRVTKVENDVAINKADLRIVKWVGGTVMAIVIPLTVLVLAGLFNL